MCLVRQGCSVLLYPCSAMALRVSRMLSHLLPLLASEIPLERVPPWCPTSSFSANHKGREKFRKADFYKSGWRRHDLLAPPPPFLSSVPTLITGETDSGGVGGAGGDMSLECLQMWVCELRERRYWRKASCSPRGE